MPCKTNRLFGNLPLKIPSFSTIKGCIYLLTKGMTINPVSELADLFNFQKLSSLEACNFAQGHIMPLLKALMKDCLKVKGKEYKSSFPLCYENW